MCRSRWAALLSILLAMRPTSGRAEDREADFYSLKDWAPVHTWEYVAIPAGNAALLTIVLTVHPPTRWRGGILFDNWVNKGLALHSEAARNNAHTASSIITVAMGLIPPLIDGALLTGWVHQRGDLMWQMLVLDADVLTLTGLVTITTAHTVGRLRPSGLNENDSFFSGHVSLAASGATLLCLQHLDLGLLENKAADATVCGLGVAATVTDGFLRMMAARHYASDVIVGAAVGVGSAFLVYKLKVKPTRVEETAWQFLPVLRADYLGLSVVGAF